MLELVLTFKLYLRLTLAISPADRGPTQAAQEELAVGSHSERPAGIYPGPHQLSSLESAFWHFPQEADSLSPPSFQHFLPHAEVSTITCLIGHS